jgi:glycosyltransferase involved in cell wall biosynthesis
VLPSQRDKAGNLDGLPTVLLEAMACGLPCVASNIGGVSLVLESGENGYVFEPNNSSQMADDLTTLIHENKLREKLGDKARSDVIQRFNWDNVAKSLEALYRISFQ